MATTVSPLFAYDCFCTKITSPSKIPSSTMDCPCTMRANVLDGFRIRDEGTSTNSLSVKASIGDPAATRPNKGKEKDSTGGGDFPGSGALSLSWVGDGYWVVVNADGSASKFEIEREECRT